MENNKSLLLGVLAGAAAGAVAGILMAPDKGCNTRANISRSTRDAASGIRTKVSDLVDKVADKYLTTERESTSGPSRESYLERTRSTASQFNTPGAP